MRFDRNIRPPHYQHHQGVPVDLIGKTTPSGWHITESVSFKPDHTGGFFSDCYFVEKDGKKAFLKALDIEKFDILQIGELLSAFNYEAELLSLCRSRGLARIVQVIESDKIERDPLGPPVLRYVPFLIFELADGDVRDSVDVTKQAGPQWIFRMLHQTTLALLQLHKEQIAHQDLKPSNVLLFGEDNLKLGDLGRSSLRGKPAPHDALNIPGAKNYAPFEHRYGHISNDWATRRISVDVFNLGCLIVFSFTNTCFPELVIQKLATTYRPTAWGDSYEKVLVHIQAALNETVLELSEEFPEKFRAELTSMILDLCNPDPLRRGNGDGNSKPPAGSLWLERYVSRFDLLEKRARIQQVKHHA